MSVLIPARDCAAHIEGCLDAIAEQRYDGPLEVVVALAPSADRTADVLASAVEALEGRLAVRVIPNPGGSAASGLNAALAACNGRIVARVDAQARIAAGYLQRAASKLAATGAGNVGGVQHPVSDTPRGSAAAIAAAMGSAFGAGPAAFRQGRAEGPADTVYLGVFDRDALHAVGGFDESLQRNQDYDLNWRLRQAGRVVWLDPALVVDYLPRRNLGGLAAQHLHYGAWKRKVLLRHPRSLRLRQLAPPVLAVGLVASLVALVWGSLFGLVVPVAYGLACVVAALRLRQLSGLADRVRAVAAFVVMHLCWAAGFLAVPARRARKESTSPT